MSAYSEDGGEVEVREEDDELLPRGGLGIDLSPGSLRAAARQPTAQEVDEGQERVDADGELALPTDESLVDLDAIELDGDSDGDEDADAEPVGAADDGEPEIED
jgi:hypothetical protein